MTGMTASITSAHNHSQTGRNGVWQKAFLILLLLFIRKEHFSQSSSVACLAGLNWVTCSSLDQALLEGNPEVVIGVGQWHHSQELGTLSDKKEMGSESKKNRAWLSSRQPILPPKCCTWLFILFKIKKVFFVDNQSVLIRVKGLPITPNQILIITHCYFYRCYNYQHHQTRWR